ncbi:hypothetical protein EYZ11_009963 [Aspergillus tanneri]|uniref:FAD/NAD(P)-binding domain-containing protein n=1 Tax=Aspergillus tanneri TaxID=1220188 RepID=A0A4V3UNB8_9EURO|nr:uncharacterized protein ATNIH1004_005468 [Aspergillus tanneri]KAA8646793.1 hypothetical protein ATNIH1004_005468 [Aspergillus tanneri]THC90584.1 hypothetical protein EYZ11_009963 [Aspergillus tanneri]
MAQIDLDTVVIGGGFGGCNALYRLRQMGLRVKLIEAGAGFGGVWHWNRYPGARVDSEMPFYQFNVPAVWKDWHWTERFPGHDELRRYFEHVDRVLQLSPDTYFHTVVRRCVYHTDTARWAVETEDGRRFTCRFLVAATGSSHKKYLPTYPGLDQFRGQVVHSAAYPETLDVTRRTVGLVGNGASGLQIVQDLAKKDCQLHVFVRTPALGLPMQQRRITRDEADMMKGYLNALFDRCYASNTGFPHNIRDETTLSAPADERQALFDELWQRGGYSFLLSNYNDFLLDEKANSIFYDYWVRQVRIRMTDPTKMEIVAPLRQLHWLGAKRPSLEQDYYEMIDRPNVTLHDLKKSPITEFDARGAVMADGTHVDLDVVIFATGYDAVTGSLLDLGIEDAHQVPLRLKWVDGIRTHLGLMVPDAPNLFLVYGPQAPTSLANGPPFIEMEVDWICRAIARMLEEDVTAMAPTKEAAELWQQEVHAVSQKTLYAQTNSWYMGSNIPGKRREPLIYLGGMQRWWKHCKEALGGWELYTKY